MSDRANIINGILEYGKSGAGEEFWELQREISSSCKSCPQGNRAKHTNRPTSQLRTEYSKLSYQSHMTDMFASDLETIRCNGDLTNPKQIEALRACLCSDMSDINDFRS
jgi:hypothetical protein